MGSQVTVHRSGSLMRVFQVLLAMGTLSGAFLIFLLLRYPKKYDYSGFGELLLVVVLAVEGLVAVSELMHNQRSARISANSAVFDLHQTYMSAEYHKNVRRPSWFCLAAARQDRTYRQALLAELAEVSSGDECLDLWRMRCQGEKETEAARAYWTLDDDSHRVMDILSFFTALSLLKADPDVIRICNFFYDSWRLPLHRIVRDFDTYVVQMEEEKVPGHKVQRDRCTRFQNTLATLDNWFDSHLDVDDDPRFRNVSAVTTAAATS